MASLLLCLCCVFSIGVQASSADPATPEAQLATAETSYPVAATQPLPQASATQTSAADLSLFGILALGIIGLLWVRRHTSEL